MKTIVIKTQAELDALPDSFDELYSRDYPADIIDKFKETSFLLRKCCKMANRIDWLVSGDDGEKALGKDG